jgi:hypothetical protein
MTHSGSFSICFFQRGQTSKEKGPPIKESVRKDLKKSIVNTLLKKVGG